MKFCGGNRNRSNENISTGCLSLRIQRANSVAAAGDLLCLRTARVEPPQLPETSLIFGSVRLTLRFFGSPENGSAPFCQNSPSHCPVWPPGMLTRYESGLALWYLTAASANSAHVLIGVLMPALSSRSWR